MDEIKPATDTTFVFFQQSGYAVFLAPPSIADVMVWIHTVIIKIIPVL